MKPTVKAANKKSEKTAKKIIERIRKSTEAEIEFIKPSEFFKKMDSPIEGKVYNFFKSLKEAKEEQLDQNGISSILLFNGDGDAKIKYVKSSAELKTYWENSESNFMKFMEGKKTALQKFLSKKTKEDFGLGFDDGNSISAFPTRSEYTPLIGTPFFKQLYLADYWEMHSKVFWYKNYSGIAKLIVDMTRNFVIGEGFNVDFDDPKAQDVWDEYVDRTGFNELARMWCDELTTFGEIMIKRIPVKGKIQHQGIDPSTIWEIVTDPENIRDIKYYHQQYNTQYQLYGDKQTPISKYIINQIPPQLIIHKRINVTSYEKRGRSDLLSALLYFKYYEDYMMAKLIRAKNEAAFIWDVEIDGSDEDVQAYINSTESIVNVPPGSENVHNKAIKRTPLTPQLGKASGDQVANDILGYTAMSVTIPMNYYGTAMTGGSTKAGALVATEPVAKKMKERQKIFEEVIRTIVRDVMNDAGRDGSKEKFEVNFSELLAEDATTKVNNTVVAHDEQAISHKTMSHMLAKEIGITHYDYEEEMKQIQEEQASGMFDVADDQDAELDDEDNPQDLTPAGAKDQAGKKRAFNRSSVKKNGLKLGNG